MNKSSIGMFLLPINLLVGETVFFFKETGIKLKYYNVIIVVFSMVSTFIMYLSDNFSEYFMFIWGAAYILAIVQYNIMYRKADKRKNSLNFFEKGMAISGMICGVILIFVPHSELFKRIIVKEEANIYIVLCNAIYFIWGVETVMYNLFRWKHYGEN